MDGPHVRVIRDHQLASVRPLASPLRIGRLPDNDLVLEDDLVSGHHGRLERVDGTWRYTDLGSTNGSIVAAGPTLRAGESWELREDTQILLGSTVLELRLATDAPVPVADARPPAPLPGTPGAGAGAPDPPPGRPRLLVVADGRCATLLLTGDRAVIGRDPDCAVRIASASVSARHAEIRRTPEGFVLVDLSSTNGTRVGLQRVTSPRPIRDGAHIIVGDADLLFLQDERPPAPGQDLRVLEWLAHEERLTAAQVRELREALARQEGRLVELLLRRGWLPAGEWLEAETQASSEHVRAGIAGIRRRRRLLVALLVIAALVALGVAAMACPAPASCRTCSCPGSPGSPAG